MKLRNEVPETPTTFSNLVLGTKVSRGGLSVIRYVSDLEEIKERITWMVNKFNVTVIDVLSYMFKRSVLQSV